MMVQFPLVVLVQRVVQYQKTQSQRRNCTRPDLGSQSEKYESNGNPGAINTKSASKDRGGWSYGSYQIATKVGTFKNNVISCKGRNGYTDFNTSLNNVGGNATRGDIAFRNKWKELME